MDVMTRKQAFIEAMALPDRRRMTAAGARIGEFGG
jgi:hypothetical protein